MVQRGSILMNALWLVLWIISGVVAGRGLLDFPDSNEPLPVSNAQLGVYREGAVVSNSEPCSQIGWKILERGGSAVDAIIGTMLCEGLCGMQNMGIGGGFIMTIYEKKTAKTYVLNAREVAPYLAHRDMFNGDPSLAASGGLSIAVPGELMGYWEAHKRFGRLPWKDLFEPAIRMCTEGIPVNYRLGRTFNSSGMGQEIRASPTLNHLLAKGGRLPVEGEYIKMPELAKTLAIVANSPKGAFELYDGEITARFVNDVQSVGGVITAEDMSSYRAEWMEPVKYRLSNGLTVASAPPPAAGNILVFILSTLDGILIADPRPNIDNLHRMVESFKFAYALRAETGDPNYVDNEQVIRKMESQHFIKKIKKTIFGSRGTSRNAQHYGVKYRSATDYGTINTVVLAPNGDAVCATSTINTL